MYLIHFTFELAKGKEIDLRKPKLPLQWNAIDLLFETSSSSNRD